MALNPLNLILPKGKAQKGGRGYTPTYNPSQPDLRQPLFRDHLTDIYSTRLAGDSRTLLNTLVNQDPDVSAAVHAYLTIASSADLEFFAFDAQGEVDVEGIKLAKQIIDAVTTTYDYSLGYSNKPSRDALSNNMRYMMLLRGSAGVELVLDKTYAPFELRLIDTATVQWRESAPGVYAPYQKPPGANAEIDLNIPTFFVSNYHQNPTDMYTYSPFVSAINAIAARQEVINELYRIMQVVGYPRLDISIVEEVLAANASPTVRNDPQRLREHVEREVGVISAGIANIRSDQAFVHSDAVKATIINDKNPGAGMQISEVIEVLDAQNQAALKVMPSVVGKADSGGTAGTEARLFAMSADALNKAVASGYSQALTLAARLSGYQGRIEARFRPVELRPSAELEPQLVMRAARLQKELSLGTITDIEYHMAVHGRPPHPDSPVLSGTGFLNPAADEASVDAEGVSPNESNNPARDLAPDGGTKVARDNAAKVVPIKKKAK